MPERDQRIAVVHEARTWLGTPYLSRARLKGVGADCATFLAEVYACVDVFVARDLPVISSQWFLHASREWYLEYLQKYASEYRVDDFTAEDTEDAEERRTRGAGPDISPSASSRSSECCHLPDQFPFVRRVSASVLAASREGVLAPTLMHEVSSAINSSQHARHIFVKPVPQPGDIVCARHGRAYSHGAIVTEWPMVIHCFPPGVMESNLVHSPVYVARRLKFFDPWQSAGGPTPAYSERGENVAGGTEDETSRTGRLVANGQLPIAGSLL